ncbi:MAG TPA: hypothetical protein VFI06_11680 [Chitinophagaceae bacterium]|nr:hypothetical protein [Chitinophagaceae bacterium]
MRRITTLLGFWLIFPQAKQLAPACECNSNGPFLTVAPKAALVSLVKVNRFLSYQNISDIKTPLSMEAELVDLYKGQEKRRLITVWGDNGILCRPYLSAFKEGNYYVIAFDSTGRRSGDEKKGDYWISICGTYWLSVDTAARKATGSIDDRNSSLELSKIRQHLIENDHKLRSMEQDN